MKLTAVNVAQLTLPRDKTEALFWDDAIPGFGLRLRTGIGPRWVFQYRLGRRQRRITIGASPALGVTDARAAASKLYAKTRLGEDPATKEEAAPGDTTIGEAIALYLARQAGLLRPRSLVELRRHLLVHAAPLHRLPLAQVDRRAIAALLARLGVSSGPIAANAERASLSAFFAWCCREGLIDVNPAVNTNRFPAPAREHVLSDDEIVRIWRATAGGSPHDAIVRLLMLLGCRRQEIGLLRWDELDDVGTICLPPARTKSARPHVIPASAPAIEILRAQPRNGEYVFGARGFKSWSEAKAKLDKRSGTSGWRLHDLRRVISTRLHEDLNAAPHLVEAILGHAQPGVAGIYNKSHYINERRRVLDMWAAHLAAIVEGRPAKVVALRS
jgi:integrase